MCVPTRLSSLKSAGESWERTKHDSILQSEPVRSQSSISFGIKVTAGEEEETEFLEEMGVEMRDVGRNPVSRHLVERRKSALDNGAIVA